MLRILVNGGPGDKVQIQLPVGAVRQILKATGKLPIPDQDLQGVDLPQLTAAVSSCLAAETEGDLVHVASPDGTQVRIFVEPDHQTR